MVPGIELKTNRAHAQIPVAIAHFIDAGTVVVPDEKE
jgi:hypothetical protein